MIKSPTAALEGTLTPSNSYSQQEIDKALQDFLASTVFWNTPAEFKNGYPDASRTDPRALLRKGAKGSNTPEGNRVSTMTQIIDNLRWDGGKERAWDKVTELLPNGSITDKVEFFAETLILFGRKTKGKFLEKVLGGWEGMDDFIIDTYDSIKGNRFALYDIIKEKVQEKDDIAQIEKTSTSYSKKLEAKDAVEDIEYEIKVLGVIDSILKEDYSAAFKALHEIYGREPSTDTAVRLATLIQLFRL